MNKILLAVLFISIITAVYGRAENKKANIATFAGGCFWCIEYPFDNTEGVIEAVSGYTGGNKVNPTYEEVSGGGTGHLEAVQVTYDPSRISYEELLDIFLTQIDPTDSRGQFADQGSQYSTAIFYRNDEQKRIAEESKKRLEESGKFDKPIVIKIIEAGKFYKAEEYHQDYARKNSAHYNRYKEGSGRAGFIKKMWSGEKKTGQVQRKYIIPPKEELKKKLTLIQCSVTQENGTERAFQNEYWNNKKEGIYVDIVSGEPLYSSKDKFDSGTGWPSFTKPLEQDNIIEKEDKGLFMKRTEVRSKHGNSHLGHVFDDGPQPTGMRHCINSAALRFIPKEKLAEEGYGEYVESFTEGR